MDALIVFHVQDSAGRPIGGALLSSTGGPGPWQDLTDPCGWSMPTLTPADYTIAFSAPGYVTRELPVHIGGPGPIIRVGLESGVPPFQLAPRFWKANLCGVRLLGLPPVPGGAADPSLVLSWFYDRYSATDRRRIREAWRDRGLTHVLLSWPDSRAAGQSPVQFAATCVELVLHGFFPCPMFYSKDHDLPDVEVIKASIASVLPWLVGVIPLACVGWELSIKLSPTQVQQLIDWLAPQLTPSGCRLYVHFQQGYGSFQQPGHVFADFWNIQVGKLTGLLHQKVLTQTPAQYRGDSGGLVDILERFAGGFGVTTDSGFGHPFDCVAFEITAMTQFDGSTSETAGNALGQWAIDTPAVHGVGVMGSGNGAG